MVNWTPNGDARESWAAVVALLRERQCADLVFQLESGTRRDAPARISGRLRGSRKAVSRQARRASRALQRVAWQARPAAPLQPGDALPRLAWTRRSQKASGVASQPLQQPVVGAMPGLAAHESADDGVAAQVQITNSSR